MDVPNTATLSQLRFLYEDFVRRTFKEAVQRPASTSPGEFASKTLL